MAGGRRARHRHHRGERAGAGRRRPALHDAPAAPRRSVIDRAVTPAPAAPPSPPLDACRFAVVDVETTGSSPRLGHRVTEIAVAVPGAGGAELAFHTLLDPEMAIPPFIIGLTGISNAMVRGAPRFSGIAAALAEVLAGAVFVAHNA